MDQQTDRYIAEKKINENHGHGGDKDWQGGWGSDISRYLTRNLGSLLL